MAQLSQLLVAQGSQFVVVEEGLDASYAENLVIAWLLAIKKQNAQQDVCVFLFSRPKLCLEKNLKVANLDNINVLDFFSIDLNKDDEQNPTEKVDLYDCLMNYTVQYADSIIVIDCLSTLALQIGIAKACRFVEKLNQEHKRHVFCIHRKDFSQNIPRLETLGNIYVQLKKSNKAIYDSNIHYEVFIIHKKAGGSIIHSNESVRQSIENYNLESEKISDKTNIKLETNKPKEPTAKPQSSFRLEMSEQEIKQRDSVPLPYILPGNPGGGSKIIYVPDDMDDLDEEDPDDDLDI